MKIQKKIHISQEVNSLLEKVAKRDKVSQSRVCENILRDQLPKMVEINQLQRVIDAARKLT